MNKLSRLTALLCALLLCVSALAAADTIPLTDTMSSYEAIVTSTQENLEEQQAQEAAVAALYESFMASETFAELYVDIMLPAINDETGEGLALMQAFTEEQIGALANRIRELYGLIENPTQEDEWDYEDALLTLTLLENGNDAVVYANIYWNQGEKYDTADNPVVNLDNDYLFIRGTITVPAGKTLTITGTGFIDHYNSGAYVLFNVKGTLIINGNITINCPTSTVNDGTSRAITNSGTVELNNVTIKGFKSTNISSGSGYEGGAINNSGTLTITSSTIENCFAYRDGGAIYNTGTATLNNVQFTNCYTTGNNMWGGAIANLGDLVIENNSSFTECKAMEGGAIYNKGKLEITNSDFVDCDATGVGGAIWDIGESLTISDTTFKKCSASSTGGAIQYGNSSNPGVEVNSTLTNVTIDECSAPSGSGIMLNLHTTGTVNMKDCTVQNCISGTGNSQGGAIRTNGGVGVKLTLDGCHVLNNKNSINGGGIYWNANREGAMLTVKNSEIIGNEATERGGGVFLEGANMSFSSTVVSGNKAETGAGICVNTYGGGMNFGMTAQDKFALTLGDGCVVEKNTAKDGAGVALCLYGDDPAEGYTYIVNIEDGAKITRNTATNDGGGIWIKYGTNSYTTDINQKEYNTYVNITGGEVFENTAGRNGGAIYVDREFIENENIEFLVTMSGGTVKENTALNGNGGSIYVNNGSMIMEGGELIGKDTEASAVNGGAVYVNGGNFTMTGGSIKDSKASADGGGVYVNGGKVVIGTEGSISHDKPLLTNNTAVNGGAVAVYNAQAIPVMYSGTMSGNEASQYGGAVYVANLGFTMDNGIMTGNSAVDGGAVYVAKGDFVMNDGSISNNDATTNGGAVYMAGGNFTMHHGNVNNNKAIYGGAVYMAGTNSVFKMESGHMDYNTASDDGGAIYANGGTLEIGLNGCEGSETEIVDGEAVITDEKAEAHQSKHNCGVQCSHPTMTGNAAADCGGAIAIANEGKVHFYCGNAINNTAQYKGVGRNVFMNGGEFYLYNGANIGVPRDPDLVIIGGELHNEVTNKEYVKLKYYKSNTEDVAADHIGLAEHEEMMNMPDGEYFWKPEEGYVFVGWTGKGYDSADENKVVRNRNQYVQSGDPVEINDAATNSLGETQIVFDGSTNDDENGTAVMNLYALWAPIVNEITYVENVEFTIKTQDPTQYELKKAEADANYSLEIPPLQMDGYIIIGWYLYQDEGQNANWGLEPIPQEIGTNYQNLDFVALKATADNEDPETRQYFALENPGDVFVLPIGQMKFGDITLVADMVPAYGSLKIKKTGADLTADPSQTFLFHVVGTADVSGMPNTDMTIALLGNQETTIQHLPVGTYTVTELSNWSWRYEATDAEQTAKIEKPSETPVVTFDNERKKDKWLDGNGYRDNGFGRIQ